MPEAGRAVQLSTVASAAAAAAAAGWPTAAAAAAERPSGDTIAGSNARAVAPLSTVMNPEWSMVGSNRVLGPKGGLSRPSAAAAASGSKVVGGEKSVNVGYAGGKGWMVEGGKGLGDGVDEGDKYASLEAQVCPDPLPNPMKITCGIQCKCNNRNALLICRSL